MSGFYFDTTKQRFRVQIRRKINGKRVTRTKLLPPGTTAEEARQIAETLQVETLTEGFGTVGHWEATVRRAALARGSWVHGLWKRAKQRSVLKRREFSLTLEDIETLCIRCSGKCEVTGVRLHTESEAGTIGRMRPFAASLDRIDSAAGYTLANCRIVCAGVNLAMFHWGEQAFREMAIGYVFNQLLRHQNAPAKPAEPPEQP